MPLACKICIAQKGLSGSEIDSLPKNEEELANHIEDVHGILVQRDGETVQQARTRFAKKFLTKRK